MFIIGDQHIAGHHHHADYLRKGHPHQPTISQPPAPALAALAVAVGRLTPLCRLHTGCRRRHFEPFAGAAGRPLLFLTSCHSHQQHPDHLWPRFDYRGRHSTVFPHRPVRGQVRYRCAFTG